MNNQTQASIPVILALLCVLLSVQLIYYCHIVLAICSPYVSYCSKQEEAKCFWSLNDAIW
jgi:hypothetical protein